MKNPFDNDDLSFYVVVNNENQHSIWPEFIKIPNGWHNVYGPSNRKSCIEYVNKNWQDIKPKSLQDS